MSRESHSETVHQPRVRETQLLASTIGCKSLGVGEQARPQTSSQRYERLPENAAQLLTRMEQARGPASVQEQEPSLPGQREGGLPPSFAPLGLGSMAPTSPAVIPMGLVGCLLLALTVLLQFVAAYGHTHRYLRECSQEKEEPIGLVAEELEHEEDRPAGLQLSKAHQPSLSKMIYMMQCKCECDEKEE